MKKIVLQLSLVLFLLGTPMSLADDPHREVSSATAIQSSPSIILISIDTLRADRLSCYGYRKLRTPNIDSLAGGGTVFTQISALVPLTLPSHVSLLTSAYPFCHNVRDNGEPLQTGVVTLASILNARGYRTAAFVGSYVLDKRFGLNSGFDVYDSPFDLHRTKKLDTSEVQRYGEVVVQAATHWIEANSQNPLFVFLHLYDLHKPYTLPPSLRKQFPEPNYDTQLEYVDRVIGEFFDFLKKVHLWDRALIVFTSDHGEGLGDHDESTHGYFIYQSTLRVPLVLHWPLRPDPRSARIDQPASLLDVAPTILQFLGVRRPPEFQGRGLMALLNPKGAHEDKEIYSESLFAHNHFGCSALRSLRLGRNKLIEAPQPELYDLEKDPEEKHNLYTQERALGAALHQRLERLQPCLQPTPRTSSKVSDPEAAAALNSLGYVMAGNVKGTPLTAGPDPKQRIREEETYYAAMTLAFSGQWAESNSLLESLRVKLPEVSAIPNGIGLNRQKLGKHDEAAADFRAAVQLDPLNAEIHYNLAVSLFALNQFDQAASEAQAALKISPFDSDATVLLGNAWLQKKDYAKARISFNQLLKNAPDDYAANYYLGLLSALEGKWREGERFLESALQVDPNSAEAHNTLGSVYHRQLKLDLAARHYQEALRLDSRFPRAHYNLGLVFQEQKRNGEAAQQFRLALSSDPNFREAREALRKLDGLGEPVVNGKQ
jgi:choline-sulfatase